MSTRMNVLYACYIPYLCEVRESARQNVLFGLRGLLLTLLLALGIFHLAHLLAQDLRADLKSAAAF